MAALATSSVCISSVAAFRPSSSAPRRQQQQLVVRAAQSLQGKVVSTSMNKTVAVAVDQMSMHPVYGKRVRKTTKYLVHDEEGTSQVGDIVALAPCRPLSKSKRFVVESVVKKAQ